jgi:beta-glucanase (GH16 family)
MKTSYIVILILFSWFRSEAQTWNLVWSDEFDSGSINTSNWTYETGGSGWGNNELEYYTNRPENACIDNGNLLIIAKKESYGANSYTSARLKTQGLKSFTYGRIEARIKLPVGQGLWPAFWMLGNSISLAGWPKCGEIDIMEHINNVLQVNGTMHWDNNGHVQYGGTTSCDVTQYHVYSIEWDANSIKWLLDGNKYWEGNIANNINSTDEFHSPFFILLNFAVGGNWPGNPNVTTPFPDTMYVDYVRVSQLSNVSVPVGSGHIPDHFNLQQNYPNPFNPSTTISYDLPTKSFVSLKIFDVLGKEIETIVSEVKSAGSYTQTWNAKNLPSGVYFYRLSVVPSARRDLDLTKDQDGKAGSYLETKKLVLMR